MKLEDIRTEVTRWMQAHLCGRFEPLRGLIHPGQHGHSVGALLRDWEHELYQGGWTALDWPEQHGGRGWSLLQQVVFHEAYVAAGGPGRLGHIGETLFAPTLIQWGTPEQQARFLPSVREGRSFWAQGYSEPGAGSDLAAVRTQARLEGDHWRIDGQKIWTSWARESDWIFVLTRTEPGSVRHQGLTLLLVPLHQAGISIRPIQQITGTSEFNEVFFDGAITEASHHLGPVGQGWAVAMSLLQHERGASVLGQQAHFWRELKALQRRAQPLAERDPHLRRRLTEAELELQGLRHLALRVLDHKADGPAPPQLLVFKYAWSNWRRRLGLLAADALGAEALLMNPDPVDSDRSLLQHLWLSSRADTIYAGANEIQLNLIAERGLHMPR